MKFDTRINILLIKKKYYLVSVNKIEGSNSKPRQGFDLLGKHQQFLYEKEIGIPVKTYNGLEFVERMAMFDRYATEINKKTEDAKNGK